MTKTRARKLYDRQDAYLAKCEEVSGWHHPELPAWQRAHARMLYVYATR